jgi:hypothetical protein
VELSTVDCGRSWSATTGLYWRPPDRNAAIKTATGRKAVHAAQLATQRATVAQLATQVVTDAVPIAKITAVDDELAYGLVDVAVAAGYGRAAVPCTNSGSAIRVLANRSARKNDVAVLTGTSLASIQFAPRDARFAGMTLCEMLSV